VTGLAPYRAKIEAGWIDYNGHLRDAYYALVASYAIDDVMDQIGIDAAYRQRTQCTLYSLEMHLHYLHEINQTDELTVATSVLDFDRKRLHVDCRFTCPRVNGAAATAEFMLLHVQQGDKPHSAAFPDDIAAALSSLKLPEAAREHLDHGSRKIELTRR
jgi:acyl-CoA thioester hydrolase